MNRGSKTWIASTVVAITTVLAIEQVFRTGNPREIVPLAQAAGLWLAWIVAWPYMRDRPERKPDWTFFRHAIAMGAVSFFVAAIRIVLKTG